MKFKGIPLVLTGAASFGFTPIFVKKGFEYGYSLGDLIITQMFLAMVLFWVITLLKGLSIKDITRKEIIQIIAVGTSVGLTSVFYYAALQYLSASLAIILLFQFVWIGMIYEWIFDNSKPTRVNLISTLVTLTGVFFASNILGGSGMDLPLIGLLLGLLSAVSYAGFIYFSGQVSTKTNPVVRSALMVTGSLLLVSLIFLRDIPTVPLADVRLLGIGLGVALVGAVLPTLFFAIGAPLIPGRLANVLSSIELPVAIISAMVILSEQVNLLQWLGIGLIILAIFINEFGEKFLSRKRYLAN
ncbi:EamA family transporter [Pseudalkalibacillus caeni]|uniref:DMT family transporter n=1 Tax=Exobacillus caeni TaxID=2574798 RepID=A0A5R9F6V7_9BACL|nr:DMT family transporter [Pseudalkalibacillus caeni]TLS36224.1 DMT family transporter [Pseudalkalibacillus caeni]